MTTADWLRVLVELIGFIIAGAAVVVAVRVSIAVLTIKMEAQSKTIDAMGEELKKITNILVVLGQYEERFLRNEQLIDDIRRGRGLIIDDPPRR